MRTDSSMMTHTLRYGELKAFPCGTVSFRENVIDLIFDAPDKAIMALVEKAWYTRLFLKRDRG